MAEIVNEGSGRTVHVRSPLMRQSLMDRKVLVEADAQQVIPILPDVHVVHIGGAEQHPTHQRRPVAEIT